MNEEKNEECISSPIHFDENLDESLSISPSDLVNLTTSVSTQWLSQTKIIIEIIKNEIIANLTKEPEGGWKGYPNRPFDPEKAKEYRRKYAFQSQTYNWNESW